MMDRTYIRNLKFAELENILDTETDIDTLQVSIYCVV